ncbi:ATP-binding protein [Intrasporangium sp. YIM S08009]|uniref:ATP-binding protein n=1 Tax=Intrasporangium zincisolvens TaxID=3080018 RepID=UPI002B054236|nr:ATP-binding protein [Intrasporangium sp. YIM S08009]
MSHPLDPTTSYGVPDPAGAGETWEQMPRLVLPETDLGRLFATVDWAATGLGPVDTWPAELVSVVNAALWQRFPILVCWGPELLMLYNDAYRVLLGEEKHPAALGLPVRDVWPEVWDVIEPRFTEVTTTRQPSWDEDQLLVVDRNGFLEEAYFTWSYSVVTGAEGEVAGILDISTETTSKVLAERRASIVSRLGAALGGAATLEDVERLALGIMRENVNDHASVDLVVGARGEADAASGPSHHVHVVPVVEPGRDEASASLVVTANLRRPWDEQLQAYVELCASHVAAALAGVRRLDDERQRVEALAELDAAKSAFFTNISHELRTPLTLIAGPVEDALDVPDLDPAVRRHLELVGRNAERLRVLVDQLLDLTRIDAGRVEPHVVETDVAELVRGLAASFRPAVHRVGLTFATDVPDLGRPAWVDRDMVERIVLNLLSNALKYTPAGGVEVTLHAMEDGFEVLVTDSGIGIPAADLASVFERFRQLPRTDGARSREGAGIGLFLVRQLAELQGGHAWVDSVEGMGSTFGVRLPWGRPAVGVEPASPSITPRAVESFLVEAHGWDAGADAPLDDAILAALPAEPGVAPVDGAEAQPDERPLLLLAEDNGDMRAYLAEALADRYEVVTARDGVEALKAARSRRPDLVLADVMMPRLDGLGLLQALRDDDVLADLPVVMLTARAGDEASVTGLVRGADDYVAKPFEMRHLRARLSANLARSRERARDAAWRRAVVASLHEPLAVFEPGGRVVSLNEAFTRTYGWSLENGPIELPHPWSVEGATAAAGRVERILASSGTVEESLSIARSDGSRAQVSITSSVIPASGTHPALVVSVVRDTTLQHEAEQRRARAAALVSELRSAEDLETVVSAVVTGFSVLFDGIATLQLPGRSDTERLYFKPQGPTPAAELHPLTKAVLTTGALPGGQDARDEAAPGILFEPAGPDSPVRVWVRFRAPRAVSADERIAGDLIAQLLAQAVDRVAARQDRDTKEAQLRQAIESHRLIGHAVGVLIERHRITSVQGFEMLRQSSLNRNIKLRELAQRVVETGLDPVDA